MDLKKLQALWDRNGFTGRVDWTVDGQIVLGWYLRPTAERPIAFERAVVKNVQAAIDLAFRKHMVGLWLGPDFKVPNVYPGALVPMSKLPVSESARLLHVVEPPTKEGQ